MADRLGTQVGNYRLRHLLGQGGFAEVYLGEHIHLGTQAAIKLLHAPLAQASQVEAFRQEARRIAQLSHPHIVRVLEFGFEGELPFLVLEYALGGSLRQCHPVGTPVPLATVLTYVKQIAEALQYAHGQQVIHRDLKPQNLLVDRRGEVLLADFGISVVAESTSRQSSKEFAGTVAYAAPEQIQGRPRPASDQYALGIVVYEWLTGHLPFTGSLPEVIWKQMQEPPPPLLLLMPSLPAAVEQAVLTALAKDPKERFASVSAFATALEQASTTAISARSIVAPAPSTPSSGETLAGIQASQPAIEPLTTNLAPSPAAPSIPLPTTGHLSAEVNIAPAELGAAEALSERWQQVPAPPPTLASTQTLLPLPTAPAPTAPAPPRPGSERTSTPTKRKNRRMRLLLITLLVLILLGSGTGLFLVLSNPFTEFTLPTVYSGPWGITAGPDGNLWFTEQGVGKIGRITPGGTLTEFPLGIFSYPEGITAGPDGNLWFTEGGDHKIGRITPDGHITQFAMQSNDSNPNGTRGITAGPDGNLWFTENADHKIRRITPDGQITEFAVPGDPAGIARGSDGNLWFTEEDARKIGRISPDGQTITEFSVPSPSNGVPSPYAITAGPDGNLWFTEFDVNLVGRITPSGMVTQFAVPQSLGSLFAITAGPDGNLWVGGYGGIGRITPDGTVTQFSRLFAYDHHYRGITAGPNGVVWFTDYDGSKIGHITPGR